jgi:hypothetical protein
VEDEGILLVLVKFYFDPVKVYVHFEFLNVPEVELNYARQIVAFYLLIPIEMTDEKQRHSIPKKQTRIFCTRERFTAKSK